MFVKGHKPFNKKPDILETVEVKPIENIVEAKENIVEKVVVPVPVTTVETKVVQPTRPPNRKPMFSRIRLKYPKVIVKDGVRYTTHVFNDRDNRIQRAKDAGYQIVLKSDMIGRDDRCGTASQIGEPVTAPVGKGTTGVLMMIPEEWYKEDQKVKQNWLDEKEQSIMKPNTPAGYGKVTQEVEN